MAEDDQELSPEHQSDLENPPDDEEQLLAINQDSEPAYSVSYWHNATSITLANIMRQINASALIYAVLHWIQEEAEVEMPDQATSPKVYGYVALIVAIHALLSVSALWGDAKEMVQDMYTRPDPEDEPSSPPANEPRPHSGQLIRSLYKEESDRISAFYRYSLLISGIWGINDGMKLLASLPVEGGAQLGSGLAVGMALLSIPALGRENSYAAHNRDHLINIEAKPLSNAQFAPGRRGLRWRFCYGLARWGLPAATLLPQMRQVIPLVVSALGGAFQPFQPLLPWLSVGGGFGLYPIWHEVEDRFLLPILNAHFSREYAQVPWDAPALGAAVGFSLMQYFWYLQLYRGLEIRPPYLYLFPAITSGLFLPGLYYKHARVSFPVAPQLLPEQQQLMPRETKQLTDDVPWQVLSRRHRREQKNQAQQTQENTTAQNRPTGESKKDPKKSKASQQLAISMTQVWARTTVASAAAAKNATIRTKSARY